MDTAIIDQATAASQLGKLAETLELAVRDLELSTERLRDLIIKIRPGGLLTVAEMAEAVGRDRNYIDSVWSMHGETVRVEGRVRQTRVPVTSGPEEARYAYESLVDAAETNNRNLKRVSTARAERNRTVALVYAAKIPGFGPSPIAKAVRIDRNHVLRIARDAGIQPMHRTGSKNQYSTTS